MKIVRVPKLVIFLFCVAIRKILSLFSFSLSSSNDYPPFVSKFISIEKSTHLVIFGIFSVIVIAVSLGSYKPSSGDFPSEYEVGNKGEKTNIDEDYHFKEFDFLYSLECVELEKNKSKDDENDFLPCLACVLFDENIFLPKQAGIRQELGTIHVELEENNYLPSLECIELEGNEKDKEKNDFPPRLDYVGFEGKRGKRNDENIDFVPRLVYVELKGGNVYERYGDDNNENIDDFHGYDSYNEDNEDDDGGEDDFDSDDDTNEDFDTRIEQFIAMNKRRWKEELHDEKLLQITASELQLSLSVYH